MTLASAEGSWFVSTGDLPSPDTVRDLVDQAYLLASQVHEGSNSTVYPALERADPTHLGISVASVTGAMYDSGDADQPFPIMSLSKPFVFALVCEALGPDVAADKVGVDPTGLPFDSLQAVERDGLTNPMVNSGAIATTSLVPGKSADSRWKAISDMLDRFAGRSLELDLEVYSSASETNFRNRAITDLLRTMDAIYSDPGEALDLYTRQCSLAVTARDLAVMGATLADGGVNPVTGEQVISAMSCRHVLAVMAIAGLYEASGSWLYHVGLPAKSGIGGGIVTISPGKGGLGVFSPPLDDAGNSVRGQLVSRFLARGLGLDLFSSQAVLAPTR